MNYFQQLALTPYNPLDALYQKSQETDRRLQLSRAEMARQDDEMRRLMARQMAAFVDGLPQVQGTQTDRLSAWHRATSQAASAQAWQGLAGFPAEV